MATGRPKKRSSRSARHAVAVLVEDHHHIVDRLNNEAVANAEALVGRLRLKALPPSWVRVSK